MEEGEGGFAFWNERGGHGDFVEAEAGEQGQARGFAAEFAAEANPAAVGVGGVHGLAQELPERGMEIIGDIGDADVAAIGGGEILEQVVGAEAEKVRAGAETMDGEGGGGNLEHRADRHSGIVGNVRLAEVFLFRGDDAAGPFHFLDGRNHGDEHLERTGGRGAGEGADLGAENGLELRVNPDSAATEEGIGFLRDGEEGQGFVATDIEGADDGGAAGGGFKDLAVVVELFVFGRRGSAVEEEHLGAEQPDAIGSVCDGGRGFGGGGDGCGDFERRAIGGGTGFAGGGGNRGLAAREARGFHGVVAAGLGVESGGEQAEGGVEDGFAGGVGGQVGKPASVGMAKERARMAVWELAPVWLSARPLRNRRSSERNWDGVSSPAARMVSRVSSGILQRQLSP